MADAEEGRGHVLVLGCGVTGLAIARHLARRGVRVTLIDRYSDAGGNHISVRVQGLVFDIGAIHFTEGDNFFQLFPEVKARCLARPLSAQKLSVDLRVRRFPLERAEILEMPIPALLAVALSLLACRLRPGRTRHAADFMERSVGRAFFRRSGLRSYVERLFGLAPEEIDREFGERRLAWLTRRTALRANLRRFLRRLRRPVAAAGPAGGGRAPLGLVRAPEGFAHHYDAALAGLGADGVALHLGLAIRRIGRDGGGLMRVETDQGTFVAERVVSTMPIALVSALAGLPPPDLRGVDLLSLFVVFAGPRRFTGTVLYNFHQDGGWKRLTVLSDIYGSTGGLGHFTVEIPSRTGDRLDVEAAFARFAAQAALAGLFEGELRLVGHHVLTDAYPLLDRGCGERRQAALARLQAAGVESAGRQGTFDYIPHQSVACAEALLLADALAAATGGRV